MGDAGTSPKRFIAEYNDEPIRPKDIYQIGWAGVPLHDTLGYYGVIRRAFIPTNDKLGFDPDYASVDAGKIAKALVDKFAKAIDEEDLDKLKQLIFEDGFWKDVELLTWDTRTLRGHESILPMLEERLPKTGLRNVRISDEVPPRLETVGEDLSFLLIYIDLDFAHGTGSGVLRLTPWAAKTGSATELTDVNVWKIFNVGTALDTVQGWDAEYGDKIRSSTGKFHDPLGQARSYREAKEDELAGKHGFDPTVIIVGAGHCGLGMAARLKVLGIPHLLIEKGDRVGYSWDTRYSSLALQGPTFTNHLPCIPFPHWFPTFLPAQQLAAFMQHYAAVMDLNVWTSSTLDGENARYDEETGKWTITIIRGDGTKHVFHPRHLMLAAGLTGTTPSIPDIPGKEDFKKRGGIILHSSQHRTEPDWKGKKCIVVGAGTSAHDIAYELTEHGCDVTMIQRNATHLVSLERGMRIFFRPAENTGRKGGPTQEIADKTNFLRPFSVSYELLARVNLKVRDEVDRELLDSMKAVGYRLHDGYHGGGGYATGFLDLGGFYWDNGCCKHIANGTVKLGHSEIDHFTETGVVYKDGAAQEADIVVFATGYMDAKSPIQAILGDEMAVKCGERWEKGNAFYIGAEGDSVVHYRPLPQKGLYSLFQQFSFARFHSARLALRIKAEELGIDVTPYGNKPVGPPSTAAGRKPRPEGHPF